MLSAYAMGMPLYFYIFFSRKECHILQGPKQYHIHIPEKFASCMIECPPIPDPNEKPCNAITTSAYSIQGLFFFESFIRYYPIAFALSIMMLPSTSIVTHSLKRPKWINYTKSNALRISYHIKRKRKDFTIIYMCPCN